MDRRDVRGEVVVTGEGANVGLRGGTVDGGLQGVEVGWVPFCCLLVLVTSLTAEQVLVDL